VTNEVAKLAIGASAFAALLSPQGKILFDFLIFRREPDEFWLDVAAAKAAELAKRLSFYKLRAEVEIADISADCFVVVDAGGPLDPRHPGLGPRDIVANAAEGDRSAYDARRIALGVPEGGVDFAFGDAFPHDVNMDLLHGVDFAKGCYVGQEVVSRMKHRGDIRRRIVRVGLHGAAPAPGASVVDGDLPVGTLGGAAGGQALALLRLDRAAEAKAAGRALTAGGVTLEVL